jgi:hypothetical protein
LVARSHDGEDPTGVSVMLTPVAPVVAVEVLLDSLVVLVGGLVVTEAFERPLDVEQPAATVRTTTATTRQADSQKDLGRRTCTIMPGMAGIMEGDLGAVSRSEGAALRALSPGASCAEADRASSTVGGGRPRSG